MLCNSRRLTPSASNGLLGSTRAGNFGSYKQALNEELAEPLATEDYGRNPRVTPDGKWILYLGKTEAPPATVPEPVMRIPQNGGRSERLFTAGRQSLITCARAPSKLCAIAEPTNDRKQLIVSTLDGFQRRRAELTRFATDPNNYHWWLDLSPDGNRMAAILNREGTIYIVSTEGRPMQQIVVKGWSDLLNFTWAADGKGFYVVAGIHGAHALLYVDLQGNARVLWRSPGVVGETLAYPSPDGRHLAIQSWVANGNMWMMQNF
jgi:Tol biopolymer transport system component